MSVRKNFMSIVGLAAIALGLQLPASAHSVSSASDLLLAEDGSQLQMFDSGVFESSPVEASDSLEMAQGRRRVQGTAPGSDFIGIGASFGYVDDVSAAIISKISVADRVAIRPSVTIGDNFAVLVPLTYNFTQATNVGGVQVSPYAGAGASWANENRIENGQVVSDLHLLLSAGVDVPISRQFTLNAQANLGLLNNTEFGGTIGVGYNIGNFLSK